MKSKKMSIKIRLRKFPCFQNFAFRYILFRRKSRDSVRLRISTNIEVCDIIYLPLTAHFNFLVHKLGGYRNKESNIYLDQL